MYLMQRIEVRYVVISNDMRYMNYTSSTNKCNPSLKFEFFHFDMFLVSSTTKI